MFLLNVFVYNVGISMTLFLKRYCGVPLYWARGPEAPSEGVCRDSERSGHNPSFHGFLCAVVEEGVGSGSDSHLEGIPIIGGDAYHSVIGRRELVGVNNLH